MTYSDLGWDAYLSYFETPPWSLDDGAVGRISKDFKRQYEVRLPDGIYEGALAKRILHQSKSSAHHPKIGDWVKVDILQGEPKVFIKEVLPRATCFSRKWAGERTEEQVLAANVDVIFLMTSCTETFNVRRIERFLVLAKESGAKPIIVLNKIDLTEERERFFDALGVLKEQLVCLQCSCETGEGIDAVREHIPVGKTAVFLGVSGVGKSSMINQLMGNEVALTGDIREGDDKGRHTTTLREMYLLPEGGIVIDTPGLREVHLWNAEEGLKESFSDLEALASQCKFNDCQHEKEVGCAVRSAVEAGECDENRYQAYIKLKDELKQLKTQQNARTYQKSRRRRGNKPDTRKKDDYRSEWGM